MSQKDTSNSIKITIKGLNGVRTELTVPSNSTILSIKKRLQEIEGIEPPQLRLIFGGKLLTDTDTLSNKNIQNDDLIHSAIMLRGGSNTSENPIQITIKGLNGVKTDLNISPNSTILSIKKRLQEIEGIEPPQLRLIFKGKLLTDTDTLSNKNIKNGDLIHSAIMLRGGMMQLYGKGRGIRGRKKKAANGKILKKSPGALRAQVDLDELDLEDLPNCTLSIPNKENIQEFIIKIRIDLRESYWFGGTYSFKFLIPDNYPFKPPKVLCMEKIYHPNIDVNGPICLNLLKKDWKPILTVQQVIHGLIFLFLEPNPSDPLNINAAKDMRENIENFKRNVNKSMRGGYVDGNKYDKMI